MAWREFRRGKRGKFDVQIFERNLEDNLFILHQELKSGTYRHGDYTSFYITDPKLRKIHKATVRDRVLRHAIYRVLYPIFDKSFIYDSYSCRLDKGTHKAVDRLEVFIRKASRNYLSCCFVLKCDIKKFFASIDQGILLKIIEKKYPMIKLYGWSGKLLRVLIRERERESTCLPAGRKSVCRLAT